MISFEEFKKVEITIGQILKAEKIPNTDKLLRLEVDFGLKAVVVQEPEIEVVKKELPVGKKTEDSSNDNVVIPEMTYSEEDKSFFAKFAQGMVDSLNKEALKSEGNKEKTETIATPELIKEFERDVRQIVSGISAYFPEPEKLIGVRCAFVTNLEPREIKGYVSNGMILAVGGGEEAFSLFQVDAKIKPGVKAK